MQNKFGNLDYFPYLCKMKKCGKCGETKARSEFHKHPTKKDGLQSMCKECRKEYIRAHYQKNRGKYVGGNKDRRQRNREFVRDQKESGECLRCGEKRWYVLDYHHVDGKEESIQVIAHRGHSIKKIKEEIEKCVLLCANCHREVHYEMRQ